MSCHKTCHKSFAFITVVFAIVIAILGVSLPMNRLGAIMAITNFFDIMLPVLAVGALVKYLVSCREKSTSCCSQPCSQPNTQSSQENACCMPSTKGGCH